MPKEHLQKKISLQNTPSSITLKDRSLDPFSKWGDKINYIVESYDVNGKCQDLAPMSKVDGNEATFSINDEDNKFGGVSCAGTFLPVISNQTLPFMLNNISLWNDSQDQILVNDSISDNFSMIHNFMDGENENGKLGFLSQQSEINVATGTNSQHSWIAGSHENCPGTVPLYVLGKNGAESHILKKNVNEKIKLILPESNYKVNLNFNEHERNSMAMPVESNTQPIPVESNIQPIAFEKIQQTSFQVYAEPDENCEELKNEPTAVEKCHISLQEYTKPCENIEELKNEPITIDKCKQISFLGYIKHGENDEELKNEHFMVEKCHQKSFQEYAQPDEKDEDLKIAEWGDNFLCDNYKQEFSAEKHILLQDSFKKSLNIFGSNEIVYEGVGENYLKSDSLRDDGDEQSPVMQEVQSTYIDLEEKILELFQECSPDEEGSVLKETLSAKLFDKQVFDSWILESWSFLLKDAGPKISYERFQNTMLRLGENLLQKKYKKVDANEMLKVNSINEQINLKFNGHADAVWECSEGNRRSTLLPGCPHFSPNVMSEMPSFPSPIKPLMGSESEKWLYKRTFDLTNQDMLDFTNGTLETEANLTPLDPILLQNEVFELTHAYRKITEEKGVLSANLSKSEDEHNSLRDKINKLEAALMLVEQQASENQNNLRELNEIKAQLEIEKETVENFLSELTQVQSEKQELKNLIEKLKLEIAANYANFANSIQREKEMCLKIEQFNMDAINMKDELKRYCILLNTKEEEIDYFRGLCDSFQRDLQSQNEEKSQILDELHLLKLKMNEKFLTDEDYEGRNGDVLLGTVLEDSYLGEKQNNILNDKFKDNINPTNIKDEIISMDSSLDYLPFCEKGNETAFSPEINKDVGLKDSLDKLRFWNDKSIDLANSCFENGITSDNYELLLQHIRNFSFLAERWRNLMKCDGNFVSSSDLVALRIQRKLLNDLDIDIPVEQVNTSSLISLQNNITPQIPKDFSSCSLEDSNSENTKREGLPEIFLRSTENINCLSVSSSADQKDDFVEIEDSSVGSSNETPKIEMALDVPTRDCTIAALERFNPEKRRIKTSIIFECFVLMIFCFIIWFLLLLKSESDALWSPDPISKSDELWQLVIPSIPFLQLRRIGIPPV